ncbi:MAG: hypothetical protein AAF378_04975 [Cyanobacteria bacterium P01_A01_bin.84]
MTNSPQKPQKETKQYQSSKKLIKGEYKKLVKKPVKKSYRKGCLIKIFAIALLFTSGGVAIACAWISWLFIFSPDEARFFKERLPEWMNFSETNTQHPQSLEKIEKILTSQGKILGKRLSLGKNKDKSFLLPIFQKRNNCQFDCQYITQLRAYQIAPSQLFNSGWSKKYFLNSKLDITGPSESFVVAPLVNATDEIQGSNMALPLSEINQFQGKTPTQGKWFYLQGKRSTANHAIAYGHILYYNPQRSNLQFILSWTSPSGEIPEWKQVTGNKDKELVVNKTVGFEPSLQVYQVKPIKSVRNPITLKLIELKPPSLKDTSYQKALLLARSGLWTPSSRWLQFIKKQIEKPTKKSKNRKISADAQAQIDVIGLHAKLSQKQAAINWASPSQQVQVDLINGNWSKALQILDKSPDDAKEVASFLQQDNGSLWKRAIAALEVNPHRREVQAWFGLMLAAKKGEAEAVSWLKSEVSAAKVSQDNLEYIQGLLKKLKGEVVKPQVIFNHPSRIIGGAKLLSKVNPASWLKSNSQIQLQIHKNQTWYAVEVSSFHNGKQWLSSPFNSLKSDENLWNYLGLNTDPSIQITAWNPAGEQQTTSAIIQGVQQQEGKLLLLAEVKEKIFQPQQIPLALSSQALEWVEPRRITLLELYQQDPNRVKKILSQIWRSFQTYNSEKPLPKLDFQRGLELIGNWSIQEIDLTGNQKPEALMSISREAIAYLYKSLNQKPSSPKPSSQNQQSRPQSLILSDSGKVIYNDFFQNSQQSLTAIAQLLDTERFVLIVENSHRYEIKAWSAKNKRFE